MYKGGEEIGLFHRKSTSSETKSTATIVFDLLNHFNFHPIYLCLLIIYTHTHTPNKEHRPKMRIGHFTLCNRQKTNSRKMKTYFPRQNHWIDYYTISVMNYSLWLEFPWMHVRMNSLSHLHSKQKKTTTTTQNRKTPTLNGYLCVHCKVTLCQVIWNCVTIHYIPNVP